MPQILTLLHLERSSRFDNFALINSTSSSLSALVSTSSLNVAAKSPMRFLLCLILLPISCSSPLNWWTKEVRSTKIELCKNTYWWSMGYAVIEEWVALESPEVQAYGFTSVGAGSGGAILGLDLGGLVVGEEACEPPSPQDSGMPSFSSIPSTLWHASPTTSSTSPCVAATWVEQDH